jgi:hypothetical protein
MASMCERKREINRRRQRKAKREKEKIRELKAQAAKGRKK